MHDRPLLTFVLFAYNQVDFIADAVKGAFSQTYSPLEIILSDDCSTDGTFAVMEEMACNYKGRHRIVLNRNLKNLGPTLHFNKIVDMSTGDLVVYAEGDDISLPERTSVIYESWESSGRSVTSIYSDYVVIDKSGALWNTGKTPEVASGTPFQIEQGDLLGFLTTWKPMINGCTQAWSQRLFLHFENLPANLKYVDLVLCFRSLGINGILHINRPLIKYRRHENNFSFHDSDDDLDPKTFHAYDAKRGNALQGFAISYDAMINDIGAMGRLNRYCPQYLARLELEARRIQVLYLLERKMISEPFGGRVCAILQLLSHGGVRLALRLIPQLLPRRLYHKLRSIKRDILSCLH